MKITVTGKNMDISDTIYDHVTSKLSHLEKFIQSKENQEILAEVELGLRSLHHKKGDVYRAEINLTVDGELSRSVSKKSDLLEAIDDSCSNIERQLRRSKRKKGSLMRRGARQAKELLMNWRK